MITFLLTLAIAFLFLHLFKRDTIKLSPANIWKDTDGDVFIITDYSLDRNSANPIQIKYLKTGTVRWTWKDESIFTSYIGNLKTHPEYFL